VKKYNFFKNFKKLGRCRKTVGKNETVSGKIPKKREILFF
jgi:hypothetical protein